MSDEPINYQECGGYQEMKLAMKTTVPRWVFMSTLSAIVLLSMSFAGWYLGSLRKVETDHDKDLIVINADIDDHISNLRREYMKDVQRFYKAVDANQQMLQQISSEVADVRIEQAKIISKQDLVLDKIKLTE